MLCISALPLSFKYRHYNSIQIHCHKMLLRKDIRLKASPSHDFYFDIYVFLCLDYCLRDGKYLIKVSSRKYKNSSSVSSSTWHMVVILQMFGYSTYLLFQPKLFEIGRYVLLGLNDLPLFLCDLVEIQVISVLSSTKSILQIGIPSF